MHKLKGSSGGAPSDANPDFQPQKPREFSVFGVSTYQSDGWEPFLPDNPLKGTVFEPLAKGFEIRRRHLDHARSNTTVSGQINEDIFRMVSKRTGRALAKDGLSADTSQLGALSRGIVLVNERNRKYLESNKYEVKDVEIKHFLKAEARRLWSGKGQVDKEVQSILLADATREQEEEEEEGSDEEDEDFLAIQRLLEKIHELPKVIDTLVQMTGSGIPSFLTYDEQQKSKAIAAFKQAIAQVTGITSSEAGVVSVVDASQVQAGVAVERVVINFQIAVIDSELAEKLIKRIKAAVHDGSLGNHMTHAGLQALVALKSGPRIFKYGGKHDATQRLFGEPALHLKRLIEEAELKAKGLKPGKWMDEGEVSKDDKGLDGQVLISLEAEDMEKALRKSKVKSGGKKKFEMAEKGDGLLPRGPGMTLHPRRPATSMARVEQVASLQRSIMLDEMERTKERKGRAKSSLGVAVNAWAPDVREDNWDEGKAKLEGFFAAVSKRKRNPARGQVSDAVAAAKREVDEENEKVKKLAKEIREKELHRYAEDREKAAESKQRRQDAMHAHAAPHLDPLGGSARIGLYTPSGQPTQYSALHAPLTIQHGGHVSVVGGNVHASDHSEGIPRGPYHGGTPGRSFAAPSHSMQSAHLGGSSKSDSGGLVRVDASSQALRTKTGGGDGGVQKGRGPIVNPGAAARGHVGHVMDHEQLAWDHGDVGGRHEVDLLGGRHEVSVFQQKLRQAQLEGEGGEGKLGIDARASFNWKSENRGASRKAASPPKGSLDCRWCRNSREIDLDWAKAALKSLVNDAAVKKLEKECAVIDCPFCVGLDVRIRRGFLNLKRPILQKTNNWVAPKFEPKLDSQQMRTIGKEETFVDETAKNKRPDVVCGVCPGPDYGCMVTMTTTGIVVEAEVQTGRVLERCKVPSKALANCLCMHQSSMYCGMDDGRVREYLAGCGDEGGFRRSMYARQKSIMAISISACGAVLASGCLGGTTMIWDTKTGRVMRHICEVTHTFPEVLKKRCAASDHDPPKVAHAFRHHRGAVSAMVATKAAVITGSWDQTLCIAYLPVYREKWNDDRAVKVLRERSKELRTTIDKIIEEYKPRRPVGRALRNMEALEAELVECDREVSKREQRVRNSLSRCRKFLRVAGKDVGKVTCIAFQKLESGAYGLFAGYSDGNVRQWDVNGGKVVCVYTAHPGSSVTSIAMGIGRLYSGGAEGMIKVWDLGVAGKELARTQRNLLDVAGHEDGVTALKMCGNLLLSASQDLTVRAWDMLTCDPKMKANVVPEGSKEANMALKLYDADEVLDMIEEEERDVRFRNADSASQMLTSSVRTTVRLKRAAARMRRTLSGESNVSGEAHSEEDDEFELEEDDEFHHMVFNDMLDLTETMPALADDVKEGNDLAAEFLKNLRTKLRGTEPEEESRGARRVKTPKPKPEKVGRDEEGLGAWGADD